VSGVPGTPGLVKRHNSGVAFQPVQIFVDPVVHARAARAAQVVLEPVVKLSPYPVLGQVR
jgi:hypothetical protein